MIISIMILLLLLLLIIIIAIIWGTTTTTTTTNETTTNNNNDNNLRTFWGYSNLGGRGAPGTEPEEPKVDLNQDKGSLGQNLKSRRMIHGTYGTSEISKFESSTSCSSIKPPPM